MPYTNTQIGPDGKRHPIGDPDPFVSGIALSAEDVPAEDVPAEDGAPDYSDYEDDVEGED